MAVPHTRLFTVGRLPVPRFTKYKLIISVFHTHEHHRRRLGGSAFRNQKFYPRGGFRDQGCLHLLRRRVPFKRLGSPAALSISGEKKVPIFRKK
jgi:hypothetical protein